MKKKVLSVVMALVLLLSCTVPVFASRFSETNAKGLVKDMVWASNENTTYSFEDGDDYMKVTVVNNGVTFVYRVEGMPAKAILESYELTGEVTTMTIISVLNGILMKIASIFLAL